MAYRQENGELVLCSDHFDVWMTDKDQTAPDNQFGEMAVALQSSQSASDPARGAISPETVIQFYAVITSFPVPKKMTQTTSQRIPGTSATPPRPS